MKLLRTLILRPLRRDLLRTALTILSVALGVAVVVAIDLAGDAATGSFRSSMQTLAGKTDLEIIATGGIEERYMATLAALPFDVHFAPLMEAQIVLPGIGAVPLYGADLAGAPQGAAVSKALAARLGSKVVTGTLAGRPITFPIGQTIDARANSWCSISPTHSRRSIATGNWTASTLPWAPRKTSAASRKRHPPRCRFRRCWKSRARAATRTSGCCARFAGTCAC